MRLAGLVALAVALSAPAFAQDHDAPACTAMDAKLPAETADWNGGAAITTAQSEDQLATATLTPGKGYAATLAKTPSVEMVLQPEKPGGSVSYSGLFRFDVSKAGKYVIALSTPAWIDVIEDGKALEAASFGHGPECTTIRKMVVFDLKIGSHVLQVAGNGAETLTLMVAEKP
jgi:hypothetical protein